LLKNPEIDALPSFRWVFGSGEAGSFFAPSERLLIFGGFVFSLKRVLVV
jgi:hypothetical protein